MSYPTTDLLRFVQATGMQGAQRRQETIQDIEMVKVAAIVAMVASIFLFALFPTPLNLFIFSFPAYLSYEVMTVSENIQKIFKNDLLSQLNQLAIQLSNQKCIDDMTKNTILAKSLFRFFPPGK